MMKVKQNRKGKRKNGFYKDTGGFSTTFDIFLFLIMISISAMILLPSITGNTQIKSALESKSQENSGDTLLTLLNGKVYEFEYIVAGDQLDAVAGPLNNSPVFTTGKKIIAGKELRHKTFSDIAAENAAVQWVIYYNGTRTQLNFMMTNYSNSSKSIMKNYLDEQIGDRYGYNFTVLWRPFTGVPIGGDLDIGEPVPDNAYVESAYITMPYHIVISRKQVEDIIENNFNNSRFGNFSFTLEELKNNESARNVIEMEISNKINNIINDTVDDSVDLIVDQKLGPVLDESRNKMIEDVNGLLLDSETSFNQEINDGINNTLNNVSADLSGTMADKLKDYLKVAAKEEIQAATGEEIRSFSTELADMYVNNAITIVEAKDRIIIEVFSRININRAQATLSLWEKRK
ncbi:MAG: hypothetical protein MPEBLZ_04087 [Candidatus Methanoperedens nitroreducens]|uniref:Uncharacterized protein n=2 Tax=Candidatus Methanoperedens TaxID=1392997 RepID=A0A0N8KQ78_9EURY|nr:MAG: hypothetical protein MPEBLZ_04087 [Candidatus Methanoperedens sp. BLZ1]